MRRRMSGGEAQEAMNVVKAVVEERMGGGPGEVAGMGSGGGRFVYVVYAVQLRSCLYSEQHSQTDFLTLTSKYILT